MINLMSPQIKRLFDLAHDERESFDFSDQPYIKRTFNPAKFAALVIDDCIDVVIESDESDKMILHEPYRSIVTNINHHFYGQIE